MWFGKDGNGMPRRKTYLSETSGDTPWTWWDNEEVGHTQEAKKELADILGDSSSFPTPKPTRLLERIALIGTDKSDLLLDSFAGSGTTAHAVLALNRHDGGSRRVVLVQQAHDSKSNESDGVNIAKSVTRERVAAVIKGYGKGKNRTDGLDGSFTYVLVGDPLFGEYKDFGRKQPSFDDLAKYIFYTETSREIDLKRIDAETGLIGRTEPDGGTAYYLLYTPKEKESRELSTETLKAIGKREKGKSRRWVVYCEKVWMHQDELKRFEAENGVSIRAMLVPFNLK
jgi:adenine-specific DNA-methyltransferase